MFFIFDGKSSSARGQIISQYRATHLQHLCYFSFIS